MRLNFKMHNKTNKLYKNKKKIEVRLPEVAIGLYVWNGEKTINDTLLSLRKQSYKKIKIFILDNQSTDNTCKIVKKFLQDRRIKLIVDKKKRNQADAPSYLLNNYLKKFKYCMLIGDDDIFQKKYIQLLISKILKDESGLCYSSYKLIDQNRKLWNIKNANIYQNSNFFLNTGKFLIYRNIVPIIFGIFKTKNLINSFKYYKIYDNSLVNFDNLMMLNFLANNKVSYVNKKIFYYRKKNRIESAKNRDQNGIYNFDKISNSFLLIFKYQFNFCLKVLNALEKSDKLKCKDKLILQILTIITCLQKCLSFIVKKMFAVKFQYD
jgi:glycosyltransferase involved in cell wall biosynthesis